MPMQTSQAQNTEIHSTSNLRSKTLLHTITQYFGCYISESQNTEKIRMQLDGSAPTLLLLFFAKLLILKCVIYYPNTCLQNTLAELIKQPQSYTCKRYNLTFLALNLNLNLNLLPIAISHVSNIIADIMNYFNTHITISSDDDLDTTR